MLLEKLVNANGISGNEEEVRKIIVNEIKKYVDDVHVDKMGNVIARKKGKKPCIMLAAHMDEVGLIVKAIEDSGKIKFSTIGSLDQGALISQRVVVGNIRGIITTDLMLKGSTIEKMPKLDDMFIETGLEKKELEKKVKIGDYAGFYETPFCTLGSDEIISGKALDDRIGCYVLLEVAKRSRSIKSEIVFVFTVQEEVGLYGAKTSVYNLDPDFAIAVDVTNFEGIDGTKSIGKGPFITIKDAYMIGNRKLNEHIELIANQHKLPIQRDVSDFGTTDALNISLAKGGIPAAVLGVVVKNIHSTVGVASMKDIDNLIKILEGFLKDPPKLHE